jgi:hypothetical protein
MTQPDIFGDWMGGSGHFDLRQPPLPAQALEASEAPLDRHGVTASAAVQDSPSNSISTPSAYRGTVQPQQFGLPSDRQVIDFATLTSEEAFLGAYTSS